MIRAAIILSCLAGAVQAGMSDCAFQAAHHGAWEHTDLGGGIVAYRQSFLGHAIPPKAERQLVIESCDSGARLVTVMNDFGGPMGDLEAEVEARFKDLTVAPDAIGFNTVRADFLALGALSEISDWAYQSCACAAAYPDLIGDKTAYDPPPV